jgi:hypothetical protein
MCCGLHEPRLPASLKQASLLGSRARRRRTLRSNQPVYFGGFGADAHARRLTVLTAHDARRARLKEGREVHPKDDDRRFKEPDLPKLAAPPDYLWEPCLDDRHD